MLELFIRKKLFDLNSTLKGDQIQIQNAIFSQSPLNSVQNSSQETFNQIPYRFILSCDDNHVLLCQVKDNDFTNIEKIWIPTDPKKGKIVSFSFNSTGLECLILTDQTYIYRIPLVFKIYYDHENQIERKIIEKDAQINHSCSLVKPTSIVWWDRSHFSNVHSSIAIVANKLGQICLLDLDTEKEIRQLTVPFAIESLQIFDEIYFKTLLINCVKNFQYFVVLEQLRNAAKRQTFDSSSSSSVSPFQYGIYLVSNNMNHLSSNDNAKSIFDSTVKPQLISIREEERVIKDSENKVIEEFIEIFENDLYISLWPQESSRFIYLVKQCKLDSESSSSPKSTNSNGFSSITKKERNLDIYEFNSHEFCSEKVFLNCATKFFYIGLNTNVFNNYDSVCNSRFIKIINCGERFMVLVFSKFVAIVSKHFAEQKSISSHSPRSPLVLKKSDSFRNSGSFRRKNYSAHSTVSKSSSLPLTSIVETFIPISSSSNFDKNDEIINVFYVSKSFSDTGTTNCTICSENENINSENEIERIFNNEVSSVQHKLHDNIRDLYRIDEQFIIITKNGACHYITCHESNFGDYFHNRICELLSVIDDDKLTNVCLDGDLITNAKYIVDCFVARTNFLSTSKFYCRLNQTNISPQNRLTTWQFWITRSALILLRQLSQTDFNDDKLSKILRLFEIARTPRRRVITSLIYFNFWSQALCFLKKYFETSILQELNGEERLFLSHQMFNCLLKNLNDSNLSYEKSLEELLKFLKDYFSYYDIEIIFNILLEKKLFIVAKYVARINYSHVNLFEILLKNLRLGKNTVDNQELFEFFTQPNTGYYLLLSTLYPTHAVLNERIFSLETFEQYLDFILQNLSHLNIEQLYRVEKVFDPTRLHMQIFMEKILSSSEDGWVLHSPNKSIEKRDIINLYIFILLVTFKRQLNVAVIESQEYSFYDWNFLPNIRDNFQLFKQQNNIPLTRSADTRVFLSCGAYFSLLSIINEHSNHVFLWGKFPYSHPCDWTPENSVRNKRTPIMLKFFTYFLPPGSLHSISAGAQHILFLTDFGVFVLGSSTYGQLGLGIHYRRTRIPAPIKVFSISNPDYVKIVKIACGSYHSLAVSDTGHLYVWGWGLYGQLGNGSNEDVFVPQRIDFWDNSSVKIVDIAAGYAHSMVLCDNGDLYAFGDNSYTQLGVELGSKATKTDVPVQMSNLKFGTIRLICCGLYHTVVMCLEDERQKIFSWGLDPKTWRLKMRSERKSDPAVRLNSNLKDFSSPMEIKLDCLSNDKSCRIVKICSGQAHNVLLTQDGRVLSFGFGREGQLGLGPDTANSRIAVKLISDLADVLDISAGVVHSLAVTNDSLFGWGQNSEMSNLQSVAEDLEHAQRMANRTHQEEFWSSKLASLQKNNESIPHRIVKYSDLISQAFKFSSMFAATNLKNFFFPESSTTSLVHKLKMCLVRFVDVLDLEQTVTRFKTFHLTHYASVLCYAKNEFSQSFEYQLHGLRDELKRQSGKNSKNYETLFDELRHLSLFFLKNISRRGLNEDKMIYLHLSTLIYTWNDIKQLFHDNFCENEKFSLKRLISELYLKPENVDESITTAYFGLNLMKIISQNEEIRKKFAFDDQFMLDILKRTANLTKNDQDKIVQYQVFMEQFSVTNGNSSTKDSTDSDTLSDSESQISNLNFPLELIWRKNMAILLKEDTN